MPPSSYLKVWPLPGRPGSRVAFSTRRASVAVLPPGVRPGEGPVDPEARAVLRELGMWVDDPGAERREVWGYLDEVNARDPNVTAAVILGLGCNFACPYCYEGAKEGSPAMGRETEERLVAFLAGRLGPGKDHLRVDFYGGEPLLYLPRIRRLAAALAEAAALRSARFTFTLVTNGSLLTRGVADELRPLGLAGAKVTLDGPPDVHDRQRPRAGGGGTFAGIVANLREVAGVIPVGVGGNFTRENWRRFPELLDRLEAEGLGPHRLARVKFDPVLAVRGAAGAEVAAGCASAGEPWLAEATVALREAVLARGYRVPRLRPSPCMVDLEGAFTVNWDGALYRCPALVGGDEWASGDLLSGFLPDREPHRRARWRGEPACRECAYLPLCFGGCRFMQLQRGDDPGGVDCQTALLDATLEATVLQDVRWRHGG